MKKAAKIIFVILFIVTVIGSFLAGHYSKESEYRNARVQKCITLITFATDKIEHHDLTGQGIREALISNIYAAYQFCDDPYLAQQLHDLWNTLIFESDSYIGKEDGLITQLNEIAEAIRIKA